jgi:hypothetical protein
MRKRKGAAINPRPNPTDAWMQDPMATNTKTARAGAGSSGKGRGILPWIACGGTHHTRCCDPQACTGSRERATAHEFAASRASSILSDGMLSAMPEGASIPERTDSR